jgi:tripartite-type tricarboxylate transporter receptor subunit TctC
LSRIRCVAVSLYPTLAYKPDVDFEPIGLVVEQPILIVARKDFPPKDLGEFVAYVKANAEKLNMAHGGVGSKRSVVTAARSRPFQGGLGRRRDPRGVTYSRPVVAHGRGDPP